MEVMTPLLKNEEPDDGRHGRTVSAAGGLRPTDATIPTREAVPLFATRGVPRSQRSIERYCKEGKLEAHLDPDEEIYYIDEKSVAELITLLVEIKNRHSTEPATPSDSVGDDGGQRPTSTDREGDEELENELKKRDDQILNLRIDVRAKEQAIVFLKDQMEADRNLLVETTRRLGHIEERLGIEVPKKVEMDEEREEDRT